MRARWIRATAEPAPGTMGHVFPVPWAGSDAWGFQADGDDGYYLCTDRDWEGLDVDTAEAIRQKLGLQPDELEALLGAVPHPVRGGPDGRLVAQELRARFRLPDDVPLPQALEEAGVLTAEEAAWLAEEGA